MGKQFISATLNGASIYIFAKRNPEKVKDEAGLPMWRDISHFPIPGARRAIKGGSRTR